MPAWEIRDRLLQIGDQGVEGYLRTGPCAFNFQGGRPVGWGFGLEADRVEGSDLIADPTAKAFDALCLGEIGAAGSDSCQFAKAGLTLRRRHPTVDPQPRPGEIGYKEFHVGSR